MYKVSKVNDELNNKLRIESKHMTNDMTKKVTRFELRYMTRYELNNKLRFKPILSCIVSKTFEESRKFLDVARTVSPSHSHNPRES